MRIRINFLTTLSALIFALLSRNALANDEYTFKVIAKTGEAGLTALGRSPSINDQGVVAFTGMANGISSLFVVDANNTRTNLSGGRADRFFDETVQINNRNLILATDRTTAGVYNTGLGFVRLWNASSPGSAITVASAGSAGDRYTGIMPGGTVDNSVNHNVVFVALHNNNAVLVPPNLQEIGINPDSLPSRAMLSDFGRFVVRLGDANAPYIGLYKTDHTLDTVIADKPKFTKLGRSPGIIDRGRIVVFYGELSAEGAASINAYHDTLHTSSGESLHLTLLEEGPGIFVSLPHTEAGLTNARVIQRIAGVAGNGHKDPGEFWIDVNKNGRVDVGEDQGIFGGFDKDARVSVSSCSANNLTILFNATDTSGKLGIYWSHFFYSQTAQETYSVVSPTLIIRQDDEITGLDGAIQDIDTYDPGNIHKSIAFWVTMTSGVQAIIRATRKEADAKLEETDVLRWFNPYIQKGDGTPCEIRQHNDVKELIDGKETFAEMVKAIRTVDGSNPKHFIYMLNWYMDTTLGLPTGNPLEPNISLGVLLQNASSAGVEIRALIWDQLFSTNNAAVKFINSLPMGKAFLDNKTLPPGSHHQKVLIVNGSEGLIAFCGGVDFNQDRIEGGTNNSLHDVHCRIQGPAAYDLLQVFIERWHDYVRNQRTSRDGGKTQQTNNPLYSLRGDSITPTPIAEQTNYVQIGRTYGNGFNHAIDWSNYDWWLFWNSYYQMAKFVVSHYGNLSKSGYTFAPYGEQTARQIFLKAIREARKFIYIEDQYLVNLEARDELLKALPNIQHLTIVIPQDSMIHHEFLGQEKYRRYQFIAPLKAAGGDKVRVFYLNSPKHAYVHAKTWIFDDEFAIIGSANCNRRGWTHDSEVTAGICDQGDGQKRRLPHQLRMRLWAEHLGLEYADPAAQALILDGVCSADLWLTPPSNASIAPYQHETGFHYDPVWDTFFDPFGG